MGEGEGRGAQGLQVGDGAGGELELAVSLGAKVIESAVPDVYLHTRLSILRVTTITSEPEASE